MQTAMENPNVTHVSPIFRAPKSRHLVSAWTLHEHADHLLAVAGEFRDVIDQLIFMCDHAQPDGSLPRSWPADERKDLTAQLNELGISTLNDYSGLRTTWAELARSPKTVDALIANVVAECEYTGADGVDLDFEHLSPDQRFAYGEFVRKLAEALHARQKMLSICTASPSRAETRDHGVPFLDTSWLAHYVDHLRPMNYDFFYPSSPVLGPTSTAPWARERMQYLLAQAPRHKIIMGLPTYSVDWDVTEPVRSRQIYDYEWLAAREKESEIGRAWLAHWDVGLMRYTDAQGHIHYVYVTDARSTQSHLETVIALDLGGVCFWATMGEDPEIWERVRHCFRR
jgi:spore germination protein